MFAFQDKRGPVELAFTDRLGGTSAGPFAELDLALPRASEATRVHDERCDAIEENWDIVSHAMVRGRPPDAGDLFALPPGARSLLRGVVGMRQVHGSHVEVVDDHSADEPEADGLVTTRPGYLLAARAADCVPVLLADAERGVVAAVHAGRKGLAANVVGNAVATMCDVGAQEIVAWIGPHACGRCYEVPESMRDEVTAQVPQARSQTSWGTPALDLGAGVAAQLHGSGRVSEVVTVGRCTIEDEGLYSHRRDGDLAGRHAGLIWMRP